MPEIQAKPDQEGADNNKEYQVSHSIHTLSSGKDNAIIADIICNYQGVLCVKYIRYFRYLVIPAGNVER